MGQDSIHFDKELENGSGRLLGVDILPHTGDITSITKDTPLDINILHTMLGHPNSNVVAATSKKYGFRVKGPHHVCQNCTIAKSKKKNVPKVGRSLATEKGERISIDILSVITSSFGKNKFWLLIQDECTGHIWSEFITKKSQLLCYTGSIRLKRMQISRSKQSD
jgi:hypothetical protein